MVPKLEKHCRKLMRYTLPTESATTQSQAFKEITDLVTLFPGLRSFLLRSKSLQKATSKQAISALWDRSVGPPDDKWMFWQTLAATCLSDTRISAIVEESTVPQRANCATEGPGVIERLLLEIVVERDESSATSKTYAAICIRYLGGILDLPGFWSDMGIVHSWVARKLCSEMIAMLKNIGADILKLGRKDEPDPLLDYDGLDFLATAILSGLLDWFNKLHQEDWAVQPWFERLCTFVQLLRQPRSAELLPISSAFATSAFEDVLPTKYQNVELEMMIQREVQSLDTSVDDLVDLNHSLADAEPEIMVKGEAESLDATIDNNLEGSPDAGPLVPAVTEQTEGSLSSTTFPLPSQCAGQKKALLIGISTCKTEGYRELDGAHKNVRKMEALLLDVYHYTPSEITVLVDDGIEDHVQPTRDHILAAIAELVKDVKAGDQLCFYYSGHSTQRDNRSNSEEDGKDECLVPLDGEEMMIVDNHLHAALVRPLPSGSHLVAILDTCHSGSLLDLKHYRCNRVHVPWIFRGKRNSEDIWNGIVRRGARLLTASQMTSPAFQTLNAPTTPVRTPTRRSVISVMCDPAPSSIPSLRSSTAVGGLARSGSGLIAKSGLARAGSAPLKGSLDRLRTLSLSIPSGDKDNDKENLTASDVGPILPAISKLSWILPEEMYCDSPVAQSPCNGWCRNPEGHSTVTEEEEKDDEVKADVISLASCKDSQKAWEADGVSMTSSLVELLREDPHQSLKDLLLSISHATYSIALMRHSRSKVYKKQRKNYVAKLAKKIMRLESGNQSTASLVLHDTPPAIVPRPTTPYETRHNVKKKGVRRVSHIARLKQQLKDVLKDKGYDMDDFQNPELASSRPLDMSRPWKM
ncbi:Metacaspase type II [Mycena venus]|uniref:Metacaspase type II n=1 Tax=Mycena venus TaxID=2733690 RepID=A0A8H6YGW5_9AGAR|nr:Metacaspase type II [Mycena venus]